jgi:putative hydrolase of HD superfamily
MLLDFLSTIQQLKRIKRTGWLDHNVANPESIADHMHRMSVIALLLPIHADRDRLIKMTIIHDIAEAVVGDITPSQMKKEEKNALELAAMTKFSNNLGTMADEMLELWLEYEAGISPTALLCKDIDKFEMILQAFEYEQDGNYLPDFFASTKGKFKTDPVIKLVEELYSKRESFLSLRKVI